MTRRFNIEKDYVDEQLIFSASQDCSDILKSNRIDRNSGSVDTAMGLGRKVASVPIDVLDHWITEGIDYRLIQKDPSMKKKFYQKLNSREWQAFKTYDGNIGGS
jgi:hypothetical protein